MLTEQADAWFYKRNLSPINMVGRRRRAHLEAKFAPLEFVASKPAPALAGGAQFLDLAGDGQLGPGAICTARRRASTNGPWTSRLGYLSCPSISCPTWTGDDPNLKFVDLTAMATPTS